VVDAGEEVGVVADGAGQVHLRLGLRQQAQLEEGRLIAAVGQRQRQRAAQRAPHGRGARHQRPQVARRQRREQFVDARAPRALRARQLQVEHLVADGHADAQRFVLPRAAEGAKGQVLHREVAVRRVGRFDPAAQRGVVCVIEHGHGAA
jgi:hypothetical protein